MLNYSEIEKKGEEIYPYLEEIISDRYDVLTDEDKKKIKFAIGLYYELSTRYL